MNIIIDQGQKAPVLQDLLSFYQKKKFEAGFHNVHRSEKKG